MFGMRSLGRRTALLAAVLALAMPAVDAHARDGSTLDTMLKNKVLRVGWIINPPGSSKNLKTGEIEGFYIDIIKFILAQVNVTPQYVETKWSTFPAGLQSNQFDILVGGTYSTIPRSAALAFTRPIFFSGYTAAVRQGDDRFRSLADIDKPGVTVAVVQGSGGHEFVKRTFKNAKINALDSADLAADLNEVQMKRADVAIEDTFTTQRYMAAHPGLVNLFGDKPFNMSPIAWGMRHGDYDLREFIDKSLEWMSVNGKIDEIINNYPGASRYVVDVKYREIKPAQ
ncbi:MAG: amino acid ABC transporter substrate-binding protein [Proteobacteria bacterium]|nr:amino acid ABC transporter substrate-binding protein [Pseudomonadota bacterium]